MVIRFAHFADVHLGSFRDKRLRDLNFRAFEETIDYCIREKLDFVVIAGDLFDISVPDLSVASKAAAKLLELREAGIPCYAIYGSHDYTPTEASIIDVLNSAGLLIKVAGGDYNASNKLCLKPVRDEKTGVTLVGISARAKSIDSSYFYDLDLQSLEALPSPKVFVFHNTLAETKPDFLGGVAALPFSAFPKGFEYYAGGHVHEQTNVVEPGYGRFVFPGPLFAADYRDLEELSKHESGFMVVELENGVAQAKFVGVSGFCKVELFEYDATGKKPADVSVGLSKLLSSCENGVVLLKLFGELDGGASEIDFVVLHEDLEKKNCVFYLNRNALKTKSVTQVRVPFSSRREVEEKIFKELLGQQNYSAKLSGALGIALSESLFEELRKPAFEGEGKRDYEEKLVRQSLEVFRLA